MALGSRQMMTAPMCDLLSTQGALSRFQSRQNEVGLRFSEESHERKISDVCRSTERQGTKVQEMSETVVGFGMERNTKKKQATIGSLSKSVRDACPGMSEPAVAVRSSRAQGTFPSRDGRAHDNLHQPMARCGRNWGWHLVASVRAEITGPE